MYQEQYFIKTSSKLRTKKFSQTYKISPPLIHVESVHGSEVLFKFSAPDQVHKESRYLNWLAPKRFQELFQPNVDTQNFQHKISAQYQTQSNVELAVQKPQPWESDAFLTNISQKFDILNEIHYKNPFFECRKLEVSNTEKSFDVLQGQCFEILFAIFDYNMLFNIMSNLNQNKLITLYKQELQNAAKEERYNNCQRLVDDQKIQFYILFSNFLLKETDKNCESTELIQ